jgi:hypothetical protein
MVIVALLNPFDRKVFITVSRDSEAIDLVDVECMNDFTCPLRSGNLYLIAGYID